MIIKWLTGLIKGKKRKEKVKVEIEELKKAILEDPKFRDEILRELEYRTGRRDLLKVGVLGLLGLSLGMGGSYAYNSSVGNNTVREVVSDYAGTLNPDSFIATTIADIIVSKEGDYTVARTSDGSILAKDTDDVTVINTALNDAKDYGTVLIKGFFNLSSSIEIPSKRTVIVNGVLRQADSVHGNQVNIVRNRNHISGDRDITLIFLGGYIDGNNANQPMGYKERHAVWFKKVRNLKIYNMEVRNPYHWACRIEYCDGVTITNFVTFSSGDKFRDGLDLIDTINAEINGVRGHSGDDLVSIKADKRDIKNIVVTNVVGSSERGCGIKINQGTQSIHLGHSVVIRDIVISNVIVESSNGHGIKLHPIGKGSRVENVQIINFKAPGVRIGSNAGEIFRRLIIKGQVTAPNPPSTCIFGGGFNTIIEDSVIDVIVHNVPNGHHGISLFTGSKNRVIAVVNYGNNGNNIKTCRSIRIRNMTNTEVNAIVDGGDIGIDLGNSKGIKVSAIIKNTTQWPVFEGDLADYNIYSLTLENVAKLPRIVGKHSKIECMQITQTNNKGKNTLSK